MEKKATGLLGQATTMPAPAAPGPSAPHMLGRPGMNHMGPAHMAPLPPPAARSPATATSTMAPKLGYEYGALAALKSASLTLPPHVINPEAVAAGSEAGARLVNTKLMDKLRSAFRVGKQGISQNPQLQTELLLGLAGGATGAVNGASLADPGDRLRGAAAGGITGAVALPAMGRIPAFAMSRAGYKGLRMAGLINSGLTMGAGVATSKLAPNRKTLKERILAHRIHKMRGF